RAYTMAMKEAGADLRERTQMTGLVTSGGSERKVIGVETPDGVISTERVLLTGGPSLRAIGRTAGIQIPVGGARHQIAVTEPHPGFDVDRAPMIFDLRAGLYWRLEEGGLLFGMSNPSEPPGEARSVDWDYMKRMRFRLAELVPLTRTLDLRKVWAATIDYTPDHLPILGPATTFDDSIEGVTVAAAGGHGMMWGPAVARIAADLALEGKTGLTDVSELGLDRFDAEGRSRLQADPIALPFPGSTD
ncbi:MAG: NAD(P)/FAD-dependent oxidoreductase, partial [Actinomycetota bacterium]